MNRTINLRTLGDGDLPLFKTWLYLPHVARWYHDPLDWIREVETRNSDFWWLHHFIAEADGAPVGFCQFYEYRKSGETWHGGVEVEGAYSIDYLIGDPARLGTGLGKAMVGELVRAVRAQGDAARIIVQPEPENTASCRTLLSCGFVFDDTNSLYRLELTPEPRLS